MPAMPDERQYAAPEPYQVKQEKMESSTKQDTGAPAFGIAPEPSTAELLQKLKTATLNRCMTAPRTLLRLCPTACP